jgi:hypothetical protein
MATSASFDCNAADQAIGGGVSSAIETLLDADPDTSLWERLNWHFRLPSHLAAELDRIFGEAASSGADLF